MMSISAKSRARLQAKARRADLSRGSAAVKLIRHFPAPDFRGELIGGYWPLPDEMDCRPLLWALADMGFNLALPCTPRKGHPLVFRAWHPDDLLKAGPYGTKEPRPDKLESFPQVLLVPLLAYTEMGERLGYGGGFYDRTIAGLRKRGEVFTCGVAYTAQKVAHLPTEPHDERLDAVLTEQDYRVF